MYIMQNRHTAYTMSFYHIDLSRIYLDGALLLIRPHVLCLRYVIPWKSLVENVSTSLE